MSTAHAEQAEDKAQTPPTEHQEPLKPFDLMLEFEEILARIKSLILGVYAMRTDHEDKNAELYLLSMAEECCDGIKDVARRSVQPFARSGVVAYTAPNPDMKIDRKTPAHDSLYLIDAPAFGGNSGGPVLREPGPLRGGVFLLGLVTGNMIGRDYAIITRPEKISETLSHARGKAKLNAKGWAKSLPRLPVRCTPDK